ncbi:glgB1 [Symbiodinium sp. CCMP2456]|nr:glgB1 [Symbiodinium sp. CCMP2456]
MALFCWIYDSLVHPLDEFRDLSKVVKGLTGLAPGRAHAMRGRVVFMESHDTAASDRYGRVPAAVHNGRAFMKEGAEGGGGDAFQQAGGRLPYPDPEEVATNEFAWRRAALGLVLMFTCPGVPMLLQGQEVGDCQPYCWPNGPALDWDRAMETSGIPAAWKMLCQDLIALRVGRSGTPSASPLQGDGIHIFHDQGGVLAYLRWHEAEESRNKKTCGVRLALVVLNFRNHNFGHYTIGVPPSRIWHIAASTPRLENIPDDIQVGVAIAGVASHVNGDWFDAEMPTGDPALSYSRISELPRGTFGGLCWGSPDARLLTARGSCQALCEDIIRKSISIDNVVQIMMTAKAHRADGLKDICMASVQDFIITNEEKIKPTPAFKELIQDLLHVNLP